MSKFSRTVPIGPTNLSIFRIVCVLLILNSEFAASSKAKHSSPPAAVYSSSSSSALRTDRTCASVILLSGHVIEISERGIKCQKDFEKVRYKKLSSASLHIPDLYGGESCHLEVCGYNEGPKYSEAGGRGPSYCRRFDSGEVITPEPRFDKDFVVSSMSCGCMNKTSPAYKPCAAKRDSHSKSKDKSAMTCARRGEIDWKDSECAILFQEPNCGTCDLKPVFLSRQVPYQTLNSFQLRSIIVRERCTVGRFFFETEAKNIIRVQELFGYEDIMKPVIVKTSENFTCVCHEKLDWRDVYVSTASRPEVDTCYRTHFTTPKIIVLCFAIFLLLSYFLVYLVRTRTTLFSKRSTPPVQSSSLI